MHRRDLLRTSPAFATAVLVGTNPSATQAATITASGIRVGAAKLHAHSTGPRDLRFGDTSSLHRRPVERYNTCGVDASLDGEPRGIGFFGADIAHRLDAGECLVARIEHAEPFSPDIDARWFSVGVYRVPSA